MTHVVLHGEVAAAVGRAEWDFEIDRPVEALQAVEVNSDGKLMDYFYKNMDKEYRIVVDGNDSPADDLVMLHNQVRSVHVLPVVRGSGNNSGGWIALLGVLIIALVLIAPAAGVAAGAAPSTAGSVSGWTALTTAATFTKTGAFFLTLGVQLTLSGLASLLAPSPSTDTNEKPENKPSYIFSGAVNTYRQGGPVPIGFGIFFVGSQVISAGISAVDLLPGAAGPKLPIGMEDRSANLRYVPAQRNQVAIASLVQRRTVLVP